jgi:hypothetical protein
MAIYSPLRSGYFSFGIAVIRHQFEAIGPARSSTVDINRACKSKPGSAAPHSAILLTGNPRPGQNIAASEAALKRRRTAGHIAGRFFEAAQVLANDVQRRRTPGILFVSLGVGAARAVLSSDKPELRLFVRRPFQTGVRKASQGLLFLQPHGLAIRVTSPTLPGRKRSSTTSALSGRVHRLPR